MRKWLLVLLLLPVTAAPRPSGGALPYYPGDFVAVYAGDGRTQIVRVKEVRPWEEEFEIVDADDRHYTYQQIIYQPKVDRLPEAIPLIRSVSRDGGRRLQRVLMLVTGRLVNEERGEVALLVIDENGVEAAQAFGFTDEKIPFSQMPHLSGQGGVEIGTATLRHLLVRGQDDNLLTLLRFGLQDHPSPAGLRASAREIAAAARRMGRAELATALDELARPARSGRHARGCGERLKTQRANVEN